MAVSTPPFPGHLPFISSSTLQAHLAPRHPYPADKKTVAVHPLRFFSGTILTTYGEGGMTGSVSK